jgi:hypothetical protein
VNVLMFSPGFPWEMVHFTRGLAQVGARVIGLGEGPVETLPPLARESLADYIRVRSLWDEAGVIEEVRRFARRQRLDRVECLWEPGMMLAARLREALDLPGLTVAQTLPFRDKERMKEVLDAAGIRTPRHARATSEAGCRGGAERIGFPLILKPIAGAGSADTHKVTDARELDAVLASVGHVPEVSVEEYIEGEEFTFDTICVDGRIAYHNVAWYRPKPLIGRTNEWISPQTVTLRDLDAPPLRDGIEMGRRVLDALQFRTGFTHMEWFRTPSGEAVFGEIGARPPGARSVELMNYGCDLDTFGGWAEAACHGRFSQTVERRYNAAVIFKRAQGQGRIRRVEGLERLVSRFRQHIVCIDLLPVGAPRRNWKQTLISDGYIILRHPDLQATLEMADRVGTDLQLYAG